MDGWVGGWVGGWMEPSWFKGLLCPVQKAGQNKFHGWA